MVFRGNSSAGMNAAAAIWMRTRPADGSLNTAGDPRRQSEIVDIAGTGGHDGAASTEGGANANQNTEFSHCHIRCFPIRDRFGQHASLRSCQLPRLREAAQVAATDCSHANLSLVAAVDVGDSWMSLWPGIDA